MKKKLVLKKEIIANLDEVKGGAPTAIVKTVVVDTIAVTISEALPFSCTIPATIALSYNHCPTVKTDCDSCQCYSRWCGV